MAVDGVFPALAIRSSVGIELWASSGPKLPYEYKPYLPREETKNSRTISFSADGRFFAYSNGHEVKILTTDDWQVQCTLPRPRAFYLKFSPCGNYICTWELYVITKDIPEDSPNMFVYDTFSGSEVFSIVQKKQTDWEPSWSADESLFGIVVGGEALFYNLSKDPKGFTSSNMKIEECRGGVLSIGPGNSPPFIAFYTPGAKGAPSMCKIYKYPSVRQNQAVACKSFFADRVEMLWNKRGTGLLLLSSTEVDKSGSSYYGNQALHFLATKGDSCSVPMSKKGPVHCVKWSPNATEFVVVYGYMPSNAALYNLKCDVVFDFGSGPRNCAFFNPFGNLVVLAGFGNLPGNVEIWDTKTKEKIANIKCPDTTHFEWSPNGEYFVTATTAPRLRIGNGFKIYHYSGALMHETIWPEGQELLGVEWQQFPENSFTEPIITKVKQEGIKSSQPEASNKVYTPPHLRGKNAEVILPQNSIPGLFAGNSPAQVNNCNNNKKQNSQKYQFHQHATKAAKQAKVKKSNQNNVNGANNASTAAASLKSDNVNYESMIKQELNENNENSGTGAEIIEGNEQRSQQKRLHNQRRSQQNNAANSTANNNDNESPNTKRQQTDQQLQEQHQQNNAKLPKQSSKKAANPEKAKKIRIVAQKLSDIKKLKARRDQGQILELNQLNKISMEAKFLEELKALKLSD